MRVAKNARGNSVYSGTEYTFPGLFIHILNVIHIFILIVTVIFRPTVIAIVIVLAIVILTVIFIPIVVPITIVILAPVVFVLSFPLLQLLYCC
jgi:hypothetical protein